MGIARRSLRWSKHVVPYCSSRVEVLVLDNHRMVGQSIAGVLSEVAGLNVLGCCCMHDAKTLIQQRPPRLLVLDMGLGGACYREAADLLLLLRPEAELLFLTGSAEPFTPPADLQPSTIGVVDKAGAWDQLLAVVLPWKRKQQEAGAAHRPSYAQQLQAIAQLRPREQRLLQELGQGLLNKEIAARLNLSVATVETYRKQVAAKLGLSGAELLRLAVVYRTLHWHSETGSAT